MKYEKITMLDKKKKKNVIGTANLQEIIIFFSPPNMMEK